jgi:Predicted Zn-dependent hydrolases of the beta-lactamase fold
MKIKWLGHSCFLITTGAGVRILTDPFDSQVGYQLPSVEADLVTTSHDHFDHGYVETVKGDFIHLSNPGHYVKAGIKINGVSTFHDEVEGKKRGKNIIFVFDIDGMRICHCGDLGHLPSESQKEAIGKIDIMMLPVGGTFTVDAIEAYKTVEILKPVVTIPMHYKTPVMNFPITGVEKFIEAAGLKGHPEVYVNKQEVELTKNNLALQPKVVVMDYK